MEDTNKKKRQVKRLGVITFDDEEDCNKLESGERHSNKGIREGKNFVRQPDIELLGEEELLSMLEKMQHERRREHIPEQEASVWKILFNTGKEAALEAVNDVLIELRDDPEKRAIFLERANKLWKKGIVPTISKTVKKIKFAKDVAHAVLTNEQPKVLKLLEEDKKTELVEIEPETTYNAQVFFEMTDEQRKQLIFSIAVATDTLKRVKVVKRDESGKEYELAGEEQEKFIEEGIVKSIQNLMGKDFELTEDIRSYLLECVRNDKERLPLSVQK